MRRAFERMRARAIRVVDRFGWRARLAHMNERFSPSRRIRRDGRDHRHFEVIVAATLAADDLAVDIGANIGTVAAMITRVAPAAKHVLVEPLPELAARLREQFPQCEVHSVACADHEGEATFVRVVERPTRSGLQPGQLKAGMTTESLPVEVTTLDTLLAGRRPRLVKIDVEGAELDVLRGAPATLASARPVVLFEHQPPAGDTTTSRAIHRLLHDCRYRVYDVDGHGPLDEDAFIAAAQRGRIWNFVATPDATTAE
jgi:FkbM family methyltransferase